MYPLTCFSSVDDEFGRLKRASLAQALAGHAHTAGITDLRLVDHDRDWAAGNMASILFNVNKVLANFFGHEGDT